MLYFCTTKKKTLMLKKTALIISTIFTLSFAFGNQEAAAPEQHHATEHAEAKPLSEKEKIAKENKEFIQHHLLDAHDFTIMVDKEGHHIGFPLPVIIYDKGFHFFMSNKNNFSHNIFLHIYKLISVTTIINPLFVKRKFFLQIFALFSYF